MTSVINTFTSVLMAFIGIEKSFRALVVAMCVCVSLLAIEPVSGQGSMNELGWRSIEHAETRLSLSGPRTGVLVANCHGCAASAELRLRIKGQSKVFLNRKEITFEQAVGLDVDVESVHYEFDGLVLTEWYLTYLD